MYVCINTLQTHTHISTQFTFYSFKYICEEEDEEEEIKY